MDKFTLNNILRFIFLILIASFPVGGKANDTGVYAIQPFGAKFGTISGDPSVQEMTFTGEFAAQLKRLLPPVSTAGIMDPKYGKNKRSLFIQDSSGKGINIFCSSLKEDDSGKGPAFKEIPQTTCEITVISNPAHTEYLGDVHKVPVQEALNKAQQANKLK